MDGSQWWKSLQCLSTAEVVDLECSLTLLPRALEVSSNVGLATILECHNVIGFLNQTEFCHGVHGDSCWTFNF